MSLLLPKLLFMDADDGSGGSGTGSESGDGGTGDGNQEPKIKLADLIASDPKYQEELNGMMSANRKKLTSSNAELVTQLEALKSSNRLSQEQQDELQTQITTLEEQNMSKDEIAKRETKRAADLHSGLLDKANAQSLAWQERYANSTIDRALLDSAIDGEAVRASQIVGLLKAKTQLVEEVVDGVSTGNYTTVVKFNDVDEDGKAVVLNLTPPDAVKRMKELTDLYGNLFKGTATGGLGGSGGSDASGGSGPKLSELVKDPVKYAAWRKANPGKDPTVELRG